MKDLMKRGVPVDPKQRAGAGAGWQCGFEEVLIGGRLTYEMLNGKMLYGVSVAQYVGVIALLGLSSISLPHHLCYNGPDSVSVQPNARWS